MKILWIVIALFVTVGAESYQGWGPLMHPTSQSYPQHSGYGPNVEWVCHSQKSGDTMIIASDNTQHPGRRPWWQWQNVPPGHHRHDHSLYWAQPIFVIQKEMSADRDGSQTLPQFTPEPHTTDNNDNSQTETPTHGGEGLIDIRMGE